MKYSLLIIVISLFSCKSSTKLTSEFPKILTLEDSIRKELKFNDSIKVLKTQYYLDSLHVYLFIDSNKNSIFHNKLQESRFSRYEPFDSTNFKEQYQRQLNKQENLKPVSIPSYLCKKWIPVYKFQGEYYLFQDCDWQSFFEIKDSVLIDHNVESDYPFPIESFYDNFGSGFISLYDGKPVSFEFVDECRDFKNIIYKFDYNGQCQYYTPIENLNNFPIIVQHCHDLIEDLIEFEKPDCE